MRPIEPADEVRLGLIVPSSNTNAESLTAAILHGSPATAVASRFPLPTDLNAVIDAELLGAPAELIAAAGVEATAFHGTSGSWRGLDSDRRLSRELHARTGVPTTTASLATVDALHALDIKRVALLFPGPDDLARLIVEEYRAEGIGVTHRAVPSAPMTNQEISRLPYAQIRSLVTTAVDGAADAIVCVGTNLRAGHLIDELEGTLGLPIVDSAVATVWGLLELAGLDHRPRGWGSLMRAGQAG